MAQKKPLVLIVDDSKPIRIMLSMGLSKDGYQVCEATNGEEALVALKTQRPEFIIMDVQMPVMDGLTCVKKIRKIQTNNPTPILMLTGADDVESIRNAFEAGATDFMAKPVNLPLLLLRLKFILRDVERDKILNRIEQQKDNARQLFGLIYWEYEIKTQKTVVSYPSNSHSSRLDLFPKNTAAFLSSLNKTDRERFLADIQIAVDNNKPFDIEVTCDVNNEKIIVRIIGQLDDTGKIITGALQDITEQKSLEGQANFLSYYDQVTGLPNQKLFLQSIDTDISENLGKDRKVTILVIEIKNLTSVANAYGNALVQTLLRRIGLELKRLMPNNALRAKIDNGFFAIKFTTSVNIGIDQSANELHKRLLSLNKGWIIAGREIFIQLSAGIAEAHYNEQTSASGLLRLAKSAQHETRANKDLIIGKYNAKSNTAIKSRLTLEAELHKALKNDNFTVQYQPQVNLETRQIVGVEALLRLKSDDGGFVSPADFVPILEDTGLIVAVGYSVFEKSVKQQFEWAQAGLDLRIGINLSAIQFQDPELVEQFVRIANKHKTEIGRIELEVTESATMNDPQKAICILQRLRKEGFLIALDDFGTGYSSFEYLLKFDLDKLKIDKAFVNNIVSHRKDRTMMKAIHYLSEGLHLQTIAEGVETKSQFDYLDALNVNEIQGYYISKPLWPDDLYEFAVQYNKQALNLD